MTREEAIKFHDDKRWERMTREERARFQMHEPKLCMPWSVFHAAAEAYVGHGIFTHEFAFNEHLKKEIPPLPQEEIEKWMK